MINKQKLETCVENKWNQSILPELIDYIRIPNKSPLFDAGWVEHGHMEQVVQQFADWATAQNIVGAQLEIVRLKGRTPLILIDIEGNSEKTVLLYGHLDKQPEMTGWRDGLGPWIPVVEGDKLYGRGGADDGYAMFASLAAIAALQQQQISHARCVVIIEACEESGSYDLPFYIDALAQRIGQPDLVICLDSGCGNYNQLWCTTSLRGLAGGDLSVQILNEGVHSGDASGIVPDSFRLLRLLLERVENAQTGEITIAEFNAEIPSDRKQQASIAADVIAEQSYSRFPLTGDALPVCDDLTELVLNRTWRPALTVVGANGLPSIDNAGNVLRPATEVKLSLRLPPTCDAHIASQKLKQLLEHNPPYQAKVSFTPDWSASGWNAPPLSPWLQQSIDTASSEFFGKPAIHMGEGGSIPFMGMLGEKFPNAQFMITGVLGPGSNAHGPNEFLHIPTAKKLTCCVAQVIADHLQSNA
jgi:acetylornithine deacetylase/succinyl-diaminopimelate desuccinylase-like protein